MLPYDTSSLESALAPDPRGFSHRIFHSEASHVDMWNLPPVCPPFLLSPSPLPFFRPFPPSLHHPRFPRSRFWPPPSPFLRLDPFWPRRTSSGDWVSPVAAERLTASRQEGPAWKPYSPAMSVDIGAECPVRT